MSQRRMNVVSCGNCHTLFDATDRKARCPACNKRPSEVKPLPPMPPMGARGVGLEAPANPRKKQQEEDEYAPLWEFVAAFVLLASFIAALVALGIRSPMLLMISMAVFGITIVGTFLLKLPGMFRPRHGQPEYPSLLGWLFRGNIGRRR
jgi:hypothetical protein